MSSRMNPPSVASGLILVGSRPVAIGGPQRPQPPGPRVAPRRPLRESLLFTLAVAGTIGGSLAALRALVAFQLGGAFWSPDFGTLLAWSVASAAMAWPAAAILFRRREAARRMQSALAWAMLGSLATLLASSTLGLMDDRFLAAAARLIAPDLVQGLS